MAHSLLTCRNGLGIRSLHPRQIRKSNHRYHEPLIFYSQRISPFRVEHSKTITKTKQKKLSKMIAFFYYYFTPLIKVPLYLIIFKQSDFKTNNPRRISRGLLVLFWWIKFTPTSFDPPSLLTSCIILFASFVNVLLLLQLL